MKLPHSIKPVVIAVAATLALAAQPAFANEAQDKATVTAFYTQGLTVSAATTPGEVLGRVLAEGFTSTNLQGSKDKATLIGQVTGFWALIPDLKWEPQEMIAAGDQIVVRSIASGSPKGNFFGLDLDGGKSFQIDTIDIHTVVDGQIVGVYHLEDWASALRQLSQ